MTVNCGCEVHSYQLIPLFVLAPSFLPLCFQPRQILPFTDQQRRTPAEVSSEMLETTSNRLIHAVCYSQLAALGALTHKLLDADP